MNKSNFIQTGGYPLNAERLQELETAYSIFNSLGALAGNLTIISGCVLTGTVVGDGFVYINGEVINFREADSAGTPDVIIIEEPVMRAFKNGAVKEVHTLRYATFGTAASSWPWSDFTRFDTLKSITARLLPPGTNPQMYCGSVANIPTGWYLCDGSNGTPPLQGQFIVGYDPTDTDYNAIGKTGGEKIHTLSVAEMPNHRHVGLTFEGSSRDNGDPGSLIETSPNESNGNQTQSGAATGYSGGGQAHENRPPYYTLAYIIYKG